MSQQPLAMLRRPGAAALGLAVFLGAAGPALADWLVTREGARVETRGAWTVKGRLVVFKTPGGQLASLRLDEVDLDASRHATEEEIAARARSAEESDRPEERKRSVRVITDKDVRQAPVAAAPAAAAPEGSDREAAGPTSGPGVIVESWTQESDPGDRHVIVEGVLRNAAGATAASLQLKVLLFNENGAQIATSQAALGATALPPGEKTAFKADFPGFFSFASIHFEPQSRRLATRPEGEPIPPPPAEAGGG